MHAGTDEPDPRDLAVRHPSVSSCRVRAPSLSRRDRTGSPDGGRVTGGAPARALDEREPVERERRLGQRLDRDPHEEQRVVVAGDPVRRQRPAALAAMDQDPFAITADGDRDRVHARPGSRTHGRPGRRRDDATRGSSGSGCDGRCRRRRAGRRAGNGCSGTIRRGGRHHAGAEFWTTGCDLRVRRKADGIDRRRAPDMERPSRRDGLELSGQGWSYERAVLRRRDATAAATQAEDMSSVSFPVRRPR